MHSVSDFERMMKQLHNTLVGWQKVLPILFMRMETTSNKICNNTHEMGIEYLCFGFQHMNVAICINLFTEQILCYLVYILVNQPFTLYPALLCFFSLHMVPFSNPVFHSLGLISLWCVVVAFYFGVKSTIG